MSAVVIARAPKRGTGDRGPSSGSPSRRRLPHSIFPVGVATKPHRQPAGYRLAGLRAVGRGLRVRRLRGPAIRTARSFDSCRPFEASGSLPSLPRLQFLAEQFRGEAPIVGHSLSLSAGSSGLAASVYGQHSDRRKMKCPTKALKGETR